MLVKITERILDNPRIVHKGDTFVLSYEQESWFIGGRIDEKLLSAQIEKPMKINHLVIYVFTDFDGTVIANNMSGYFGNTDYIPDEIKYAPIWYDLNKERLKNFKRSCPFHLRR